MGEEQRWIEGLRSSMEDPSIVMESEEVEGLQPSIAVHPGTIEEVARVLAFATREGLAVIPRGGGTALHLGNPARRVDILLHTTSLTAGFQHWPEDVVATIPAGMAMAEADVSLARHRQCLPIDPPIPEEATVGGALASGSLGPRVQSFGHPRDSILGMKVVLADGSITTTGGRVVKNVAGYDMAKLYIGSLGTLGVIVEATFKLRPLPETDVAIVLAFPTLDGALRTSRDVLNAGLDPLALAVLNGPVADSLDLAHGTYHLLVEFGDLEGVVERQVRETKEMAGLRGAEVSPVLHEEESTELRYALARLPVADWDVTFRGTLPPAAMDAFVDAALESVQAAGLDSGLVAYSGFGVAYVGLLGSPKREDVEDAYRDLISLSSSLGGSIVLERAPASIKEGLDVWGVEPPGLELMSRLKLEFDGIGVLNPGRFVGGL